MAVASLVLGIVALLSSVGGVPGIVCGILAIIFGIKGKSDSNKNGMATAGFICGIISLAASAIVLISGAGLAILFASFLL